MFSNKSILFFTIIGMFICVPLDTKAQNIVLPGSEVTIGEAFKEIEKQTSYLISYPTRNLDLNKKIKLGSQRFTVGNLLTAILRDAGHTANIRGGHIIIVPVKKKAPEPDKPVERTAKIMDNNGKKNEAPYKSLPIDPERIRYELQSRKPELPSPMEVYPVVDILLYQQEREVIVLPSLSTSKLALRTNLLYGVGLLTPNLGVEVGLKPKSTLLFTGSYNRWGGGDEENKKLWHSIVSAEYRYWFSGRFNGHFLGGNVMYAYYNISGKKVPLIFEKGSQNYRYEGHGGAVGISYGYQLMLGKHWNLEFNTGIGVGVLGYDKWDCVTCGEKLEKGVTRFVVAPTKVGIWLVYVIK